MTNSSTQVVHPAMVITLFNCTTVATNTMIGEVEHSREMPTNPSHRPRFYTQKRAMGLFPKKSYITFFFAFANKRPFCFFRRNFAMQLF